MKLHASRMMCIYLSIFFSSTKYKQFSLLSRLYNYCYDDSLSKVFLLSKIDLELDNSDGLRHNIIILLIFISLLYYELRLKLYTMVKKYGLKF